MQENLLRCYGHVQKALINTMISIINYGWTCEADGDQWKD